MYIFAEINPAYLIAVLFFLASGGYIYFTVRTIAQDLKSKLHREHMAAVICVVLSSLFYGLMTIAVNETAIRIFWTAGFISYFMFLPVWLRFTANMLNIKHKITRYMLRFILIIISFILAVVCVISNQVEFVETIYGNHFTFNGSLLFQITVVYIFILCVFVFSAHIRWWLESTMKRQRRQQAMFVFLTFLLAPIGFATDFLIPAFFTGFTVPPLVSILLFPASLQLYISMRINKTLSITVPNVSGYIFKSIIIPVLVLEHDNVIRLENKAALDFFGDSLVGKNIADIISLNGKTPNQSLFDSDISNRSVTINSHSGAKICDMLLTVENDKYGDALCKVVLLKDVTELREAFARLETLNEMSFLFLSHTGEAFDDKMTIGVKIIADMMDVDSISVWKNTVKPDGMYTSQVYDWDIEEGGTAKPEDEFIDVPISRFSSDWAGIMSERKIINGPVKLIDDPVTSKAFGDFGIVSAYLTPIVISYKSWGFVLFENRRYERVFDDNAVEVMRSAAYMCVNVYMREVMERNLETVLGDAIAASKAKGDFLANMSHEIRTPMNAIIGMVHIGKTSDDSKRKDYSFDRIEDASKHLLGIINDILDMSKIEAGKFELVLENIDLEKTIQRVVNVLRFRADEKEQRLKVRVDKDIPKSLIGDELKLAQVITNLVGNAIKFTPEEGLIDIEAQFVNEADGICTVQINVADTGIGISLQQKEKLFESFHQVESSMTRNFGGTGLGLSISKKIVEMMDGRIWVESQLGKGSTFSFTAKLTRNVEMGVDTYSQEAAQQMDDNSFKASRTFEGNRILIAEDVDINREIILSLLEQTLVDVECANNGEEAVRMFTESPEKYDLIFMDLQMPIMDGYEATRRIRASNAENASGIPIIAITANVFKEDIDKCIACGMNAHVGKPIEVREIINLLYRYLG